MVPHSGDERSSSSSNSTEQQKSGKPEKTEHGTGNGEVVYCSWWHTGGEGMTRRDGGVLIERKMNGFDVRRMRMRGCVYVHDVYLPSNFIHTVRVLKYSKMDCYGNKGTEKSIIIYQRCGVMRPTDPLGRLERLSVKHTSRSVLKFVINLTIKLCTSSIDVKSFLITIIYFFIRVKVICGRRKILYHMKLYYFHPQKLKQRSPPVGQS